MIGFGSFQQRGLNMSTPAIQYLKQKKIAFEVIRYEHAEKGAEYAAKTTGYPLAQTVKTLVVDLGENARAQSLGGQRPRSGQVQHRPEYILLAFMLTGFYLQQADLSRSFHGFSSAPSCSIIIIRLENKNRRKRCQESNGEKVRRREHLSRDVLAPGSR